MATLIMTKSIQLHEMALDSSLELFVENNLAIEIQGLDYEIMKSMIIIYEITKEIRGSDKEHFELTSNIKGDKIISLKPLGKNILSMADNIANILLHISNTHELDPNVKLFIDAAKEANIIGAGHIIHNVKNDDSEDFFNRLMKFISHIKNADEVELKKQELNAYRASHKNHASVIEYLNSLFKRYSRILFIRVDLSYEAKHTKRISIEDVKEHRNNLFKQMNKMNIFNAWIGYVWKLEYGVKKGYHYHMFFMFDGSKSQQDITIGMSIGELWNEKITKLKGIHFNCNAHKHKYRICGLGMVNYYEKEKISGINKALSYITKVDRFIRLKSKNIGRIFGRGEMKKIKCSAGRPRKDKGAC